MNPDAAVGIYYKQLKEYFHQQNVDRGQKPVDKPRHLSVKENPKDFIEEPS